VAEVELPQLGESVTEGVITAWLVEVGDDVEVDQAIAEISTDKVDTEIPSPVAGTVQELKVDVDDTVEVGQVLAVIGEGEASGGGDDADDEAQAEDAGEDDEPTDDQAADGSAEDTEDRDADDDTDDTGDDAEQQPAASEPSGGGSGGSDGDGQVVGEKALTSPLVRRLLREGGVAPADVKGSGPGGRITREDAERAVASGGERDAAPSDAPSEGAKQPADGGEQAPRAPQIAAAPAVAAPLDRKRPEASPHQIDFGGERQVTQDLTRVRKATARAMHNAMQTTAQLTAAVEVDMTAIMNLRAAVKDDFKQREGVSLSPLPLISRAVCMVLPRHPALNSSIDTDAGTATYHRYINLGMAVDTEHGLLVPNVKDAQDLTVAGIARRIADIAGKARSKKLQPDDIQGATFTITNTGSRGTLWDTPIFTPPQVAILAACAIEKRPVVVSDAYGDSIAIRWMSYLCLSYDHQMVDGADTARFLQDLKYVLETHDWAAELGV
jgi:pyruvate dehydrogenase E2 component (dihydrolipoamide acetyltransferase)